MSSFNINNMYIQDISYIQNFYIEFLTVESYKGNTFTLIYQGKCFEKQSHFI